MVHIVYLPPEIWLIIFEIKAEIENYEESLSPAELYHRRILQGWTVPIEQRGDWIKRNQLLRWNTMTIYERVKWKLHLLNEPKLIYSRGDERFSFMNLYKSPPNTSNSVLSLE